MSTTLNLKVEEYNHMVEIGAFQHLNRKVELIRGEIRAMNPAGPIQNDLLAYLTEWSSQVTNRQKVRVTVQTTLELSEQHSCPEPDLLWLRPGRYRDRHPAAIDVKLAIEVSDSSWQRDLDEKSKLYAAAGLVEFWIVDATAQCVHVFRTPHRGQYGKPTVYRIGDVLSPLEPCLSPLNIHDLFAAE
jgi:Uma2 family endonuclease